MPTPLSKIATIHQLRPCVRCGRHPRTETTFVCRQCIEDPATKDEVLDGLEYGRRVNDGKAARDYMIERHHWAGGWRVMTFGSRR